MNPLDEMTGPSATPPKPAPDAVREALKYAQYVLRDFMPSGPLVDKALRLIKVALAPPVPLNSMIEGERQPATGEHGIQCNLCGETLHDNEMCDDAECPIGGSFKVVPSSAVHSAGTFNVAAISKHVDPPAPNRRSADDERE